MHFIFLANIRTQFTLRRNFHLLFWELFLVNIFYNIANQNFISDLRLFQLRYLDFKSVNDLVLLCHYGGREERRLQTI